ncbi:MAG: hypothetical protein QG577_862, partial [Thermodesulfobacteriota bacterium]|nr:hypothetical protein [Thermodesulfobacteriota bacterium]
FRSHAEGLLESLEKVEIETVTPLAALNLLSEWKDKYTRAATGRKSKNL